MAPLLITILVKSVVFVAGPAISEIEEIVKDTALSLIGVESLENDEPLMDAVSRTRADTIQGLAQQEFSNIVCRDRTGTGNGAQNSTWEFA